MNIVVLSGALSSDPKQRTLPSGDELTSYEVSTETADGVASVPVAWFNPSRPPAVAKGDRVTVVGHARRRFFRAAGGAASRTEVVAVVVGRPESKRSVKAVQRAAATLSEVSS